MMNHIAAAITLANQQVLGGKRRYVTFLLFIVPFFMGGVIGRFSPDDVSAMYAHVVSGVLMNFLVPFVAVFWGSALLTDEVEGKTLVYLWTRPIGRARLFLMKYIVVALCLALLSAFSVLAAYLAIYLQRRPEQIISNLLMTVWDMRALAMGAATYAAVAFFLATWLKRPMAVGLLYAYVWDSAAAFLPGFLRRTSIRHHMLSLSTHPEADSSANEGFLKLLSEANTTETQAMVTLLVATVVFVAAGAYILRNREFLGDDPARNQ